LALSFWLFALNGHKRNEKNKARLEFGARFSNGAMKLNLSVLLLGAALLMPFGSHVVFAQDALSGVALHPPYPQAAHELVRRLREQLAAHNPSLEKWAVFYRPQSNLIEVQSSETVWISPRVLPNGPDLEDFDADPALSHPSFSLRVQPLVSPTDYKRFVAENATIDMQLGQMQLQMRGISHKFDSYLPKNEEEKGQVDAYNRLKNSLHVLPDLYFQNISLSWENFNWSRALSFSPSEYADIVSDNPPVWEKEQAEAARVFTQLVSNYQDPQK